MVTYTCYRHHGFHLPINPAHLPSHSVKPKTRSVYDPLVNVTGFPSLAVGPIVLYAGIAYANPVASINSTNGRIGRFAANTMFSGVSGCDKTEAKNAALPVMFQFQREQFANGVDGENCIETHVISNATMPAIIKGLAKYSFVKEINDEFSSWQTGSMTRNANIRNQLYGGYMFSVDRTICGRYIFQAPRFTSLVQTQSDVCIAFDEKRGKRPRAQDLATRTQLAEYAGDPVSLNLVEIDSRIWDENCRRIRFLPKQQESLEFAESARVEPAMLDFARRAGSRRASATICSCMR